MPRIFRHPAARTLLLTCCAMLCFAANSVLYRLAMGPGLIDAAGFTSVRAISGALTLGLILALRPGNHDRVAADWRMALMLFTYMIFFSFAYLSLSTGTGALVLFGAVQLTMFAAGLRGGEHFPLLSWAGLLLAIGGLVYLVSPGVTAPDPLGTALMAVAGIAWGIYSLLGRGVGDPLQATAKNFFLAAPLVLLANLLFLDDLSASPEGLALAVASGAVASGCGYAIWYAVLPLMPATRAATVQLSVPAIAAFFGVVLLSEDITLRLLLASAATLGGVVIVLMQRAAKAGSHRRLAP